MTARWDAIVIGAGTNGLTTAHALAQRGRRVLVLDRRATADHPPEPGWVPPAVARLAGAGLTVHRPDPWLVAALPEGGTLALWRDPARTADALRALSPPDAERWPAFAQRMRAVAGFLEALYQRPAPDIATRDLGELFGLAALGLRAKRLGREGLTDLLRLLPMSVADLLDEWFASDALKGALAAGAVRHLGQGPRAGGTAFSLLHHHVGSAPGVFRHPVANLAAVLAARPGITLRLGAEVTGVTVVAGRVTGVMLADGEALAAPVVVSNLDPQRTLLELVNADWLAPEFLDAVRHVRCRAVAAQVTLAPCPDTLVLAPSLDYLERACDATKYGDMSELPLVEVTAGTGMGRAHVQYVPPVTPREAVRAAVERALRAHGIEADVRDVATPADLGHRYNGEMMLDQILFMRPVPGASRHRMPVGGLYLCGPGTHPGGAILGGPGLLAARTILEDT